MFSPTVSSRLARAALVPGLIALALGLAALPAPAQPAGDAAAWPAKAVRIVVPFAPGGAADLIARGLSEVLQRETRQAFVVENRPGAGGNIGAGAVAKAPGDGYQWLVGLDTTLTVNPLIYKSMPFRNSELRPVMVMASQGMLVTVSPQTGIQSLEQFIAHGRKSTLNLGSAGYGTPGHLGATILAHSTGARVNHVPYKGNAPATTALLSNEVDGGIISSTALLPHLAGDKVVPLAVTTRQRNPLLPQVATVGELGYKALEQEVLFAVWLPQSTPEPLVQKIQAHLERALKDGKLQERMRANDLFHEGLTDDAAAQRLQAVAERYRVVIQAAGMKME